MKIKYKMMNKSEVAGFAGSYKQTDFVEALLGKEKSFMTFDGHDIQWAGTMPGVGELIIGPDKAMKYNIKVKTNTCYPGTYEIVDQMMVRDENNGNFDISRKHKCK